MPHTQPPAIMQMTAICCSCGPASGTRGKKSKLPELLAEPVHHAPVPTSSMADPGSGRTLGDLPASAWLCGRLGIVLWGPADPAEPLLRDFHLPTLVPARPRTNCCTSSWASSPRRSCARAWLP